MGHTVIKGEDQNPDYINATGLPDSELAGLMPSIAREVARWSDDVQTRQHKLSIFDRHAYIAPDSPFAQFQLARKAVQNDDIVSGVCEVVTGLAFQGVKWESDNMDDADVFNQIATGLDMDGLVRLWMKEDYTYSQCVIGLWWERKTFKVRGHVVTPAEPDAVPNLQTGLPSFQPKMDPKTGKPMKPKKNKKKKQYDVTVPTAMTFLDPMKVIPLSPSMFGKDRLAWQSNKAEYEMYKAYRNGEIMVQDEIMDRFFIGALDFSSDVFRGEREYLAGLGADPRYLIELNPDYVFRIAPTRAPYERWADIRMKSVMPLLDMKMQLMEADRVALIGQANYILLVRIGEKDNIAKPDEITAARKGVQNLAKIPIVVGDHRLQIDIITPDQQWVLDPDRYDLIDKRILNRCLGSMISIKDVDPGTTSKSVARVIEMKRHALKRVLEDRIAQAVVDHPANKDKFDEAPNLAYTPRNVQIDSDSQVLQSILALRTQKELSRETTLETFGFDQDVEAQRRQNEEESGLDDIFQTAVPFNGDASGGPPGGGIPGAPGGGRPPGGGQTAQSPAKRAAPRTANGNAKKNGGK